MDVAGIHMNEFTFADYIVTLAGTRVAFLGAATKGALDTPTRVRSQAEAIEKFGYPLTDNDGLQALMQYLAVGGDAVYVRCGISAGLVNGVLTADVPVPGTGITTPGVATDGDITPTASIQPVDGDFIDISYDGGGNDVAFEFDDDDAITPPNQGVRIGATILDTMNNLALAINTNALTSAVMVAVVNNAVPATPVVEITFTTISATMNDATSPAGTPIGAGGITGWAYTVFANGVTEVTGGVAEVFSAEAASPGTWGNVIYVTTTTTTVQGGSGFDLTIYAPAVPGQTAGIVEEYRNLSLTSTNARYITNVLLYGIPGEVNASNYLRATVATDAVLPTLGATQYTLGTGAGVVGGDGYANMTQANIVGTMSGQTATGLRTLDNPEAIALDAIAAPGETHTLVIAALINTAVAREDCVALIDHYFGLSASEVISGLNGGTPGAWPNAPAAALNSSYAIHCGWWHRVDDPYNNRMGDNGVWVPGSAFMAQALARCDKIGHPWLSPAGLERGLVSGSNEVEYYPSPAERLLLDDANANYFLSFTGTGTALYSNRTLDRTPGPMQEIQVRRMMLYLKKALGVEGAIKFLVFGPNDSVAWSKFKLMAEKVLELVKQGRGLDVYEVICDESTNPESQTTQRNMRGRLILKPQDIAERVYLDFAMTRNQAIFDELIGGAALT